MDATARPPQPRLDFTPIEGDQCVVLNGLTWREYSTLLKSRRDRRLPKMLYLDGDLYLMAPAFTHDHFRIRSGRIVDEVTTGLGIRCVPAGSTTFRRRKKKGGFEPDQSYYLANAPRLRNRTDIDLRIDPPPDLVIEVVYTHAAEATVATCRRLGVPEMWISDQRALRILVLGPNGRYAESTRSASLPMLSAEEIDFWLRKPAEDDDETKWCLELRRWVAEVLRPRARGEVTP